MSKKIIFGIFVFAFSSSCYYDNEEALYPQINNSAEASYSADIEPIIRQKCATTGCHVTGGNGKGLLVDYEQVKAIALNGKLKDRVIDRMDMPSSQPLPSSEMDLILSWINQGAPNN